MSGYDTPYGEDIRSQVLNNARKWVNHSDSMFNKPFDLQVNKSAGSVISKPFYTGEFMAPRDITQREADKEVSFMEGNGMSGGFGRYRGPSSRKSRAYSSRGHEAIIDVAGEIADELPIPDIAKTGLKGMKLLKDMAKAKRGRGVSGGGLSGGKTRAQIVKEVMKERGCSLPEASKIVKAEGLYQGKGRSGGSRLGQRIKKGIQTGKKVVETGKKVGSVVKDIASLIPNEKAKKLAGFLGALGMGRSGGMKKYKRAEWNKMMEAVEDPKLKKLLKKHKKGMKYGKGCDVCELNSHLEGKGFWEDFGRGFMSVIRPVAGVAKAVLPVVAPGVGTLASMGMDAVGLGKSGGKKEDVRADEIEEVKEVKQLEGGKKKRGRKPKKEKGGKSDPVIEKLLGGALELGKAKTGTDMMTGGKKAKKPRKQSEKMKKRGELVKKIMKERGVKLAEASKIIKSENLM